MSTRPAVRFNPARAPRIDPPRPKPRPKRRDDLGLPDRVREKLYWEQVRQARALVLCGAASDGSPALDAEGAAAVRARYGNIAFRQRAGTATRPTVLSVIAAMLGMDYFWGAERDDPTPAKSDTCARAKGRACDGSCAARPRAPGWLGRERFLDSGVRGPDDLDMMFAAAHRQRAGRGISADELRVRALVRAHEERKARHEHR